MQTDIHVEYNGLDELVNTETCMPRYNAFIVEQFWRDFVGAKKNQVVDFGAGIGTLSTIYTQKTGVKPKCVDIAPKHAGILRERHFQCFPSLDAIDDKVDAIFSSNVLEHIEDDRSIIQKMYEKLTPGGLLFLYLPAFQCLFSGLDLAVGHYRRYEKKELITKVTDKNFTVKSCYYADSVGFLASLTLKLIGYNAENGLGSPQSLRFYDRYVLPVSLFCDRLGMKCFLGKNIVLLAQKSAL